MRLTSVATLVQGARVRVCSESAHAVLRGRVAFTEKDFYLDEFHDRTLVLAADRRALQAATARRRLRAVVSELTSHGSRVLIVVGEARASRGVSPRRWLGLPLSRARRPAGAAATRRRGDTVTWRDDDQESSLIDLWETIRVRTACVVLCAGSAVVPACRVAERLRVHKLVLLDQAGGLREPNSRRVFSFLDHPTLEVLLEAGEAEFHGLSHRRTMLGAIDRVLEAGVGSVNLCKVDGLSRELFTYEGSGTLFTRDDYCRVERLSIDDFHEVERLVARGQREGLLKPRSSAEIAQLLLGGFGAWIGRQHLAGIGSLDTRPYLADGAGEIAGLYTMTRFKGERIGRRLVRRLVTEARAMHLKYVFAVTTSEEAMRFFRGEGFRPVSARAVPAAKWQGYDPARRKRAHVVRVDL
jgi:N-acetylglutamate synthase-like GNAT family acetyltransferase